jgi:hypothetical protein
MRGPAAAIVAMALFGLVAPGCNAALGLDYFSANGCPARGATRCSGTTVQRCGEDGEWQDDHDCAKDCSDGACVAVCTPGARRCAEDAPQVCGDGGEWAPPEQPCPEGEPCFGGVCGAICGPGDVRCVDGKAQACDEYGQWQGDEVCSKSCILGACVECAPGERRCENNTPRVCSEIGQWDIEAPCGKDEQCSENGICEPQ